MGDGIDPRFTVTVDIYDLQGNAVAQLTEEHVAADEQGEIAGEIDWDTDLPEESGIYTYRISAQHEDGPPALVCGPEPDKSWRLTTSVDSFYYSEANPETGVLSGAVRYTMNRAAGSVELQFCGPELTTLGTLTGQPTDAGSSWSDVYTLTGVEFDEDDEPIGPIYCVLFADESAEDAAQNRDGLAKPALERGSTNLVRALEILEPDENPVTDNNFVFDDAADPNGACQVAATGTTHGVLPQADLEWELDTIQGSTLTSDPDPPKGQTITFTYTRLPSSNSEFGNKVLTLSHSQVPCEDTQTVQIFFPRDATNHPGPDTGVTPNWYYYWSDAGADTGSHQYDPNSGSDGYYQFGDPHFHIGPGACEQDEGLVVMGDGIDNFGSTCLHEKAHMDYYFDEWDPYDRNFDLDRDFMHDNDEPTKTGLDGNPYDPTQQDTNFDGYWDGEDWACKAEQTWQMGSFDAVDWASPGHQSAQ
ncbi:MAG: hypothetical protein U9R79_07540 [Armatimonadota bacterium]|nr:hypothetical protein [Armatimonadota bacterium]